MNDRRPGPMRMGLQARSIRHASDLLRELVIRDFKLRYQRSLLGIGWSLLNPLAQLFVFTFVFRTVFELKIPDYSAFLFIGIIAWTWFQTSLYQATSSIVENADLIKQPGFPVAILPVVTVTTHLIHFLLALVILLPILFATGHWPSPALLLLPVAVAVQVLLSLGICYLVAALHVTLRDTQYTIGLLLMLGFYLTPVFYNPERVPPAYKAYYNLNPLVHLIGSFRSILLRGEAPDVKALGLVAVFSAAVLAVGLAVFRRASYHFVEEL